MTYINNNNIFTAFLAEEAMGLTTHEAKEKTLEQDITFSYQKGGKGHTPKRERMTHAEAVEKKRRRDGIAHGGRCPYHWHNPHCENQRVRGIKLAKANKLPSPSQAMDEYYSAMTQLQALKDYDKLEDDYQNILQQKEAAIAAVNEAKAIVDIVRVAMEAACLDLSIANANANEVKAQQEAISLAMALLEEEWCF